MTCKSKKESAVLRVMLGSTLHNWTQKSEIPQVSTLMCTTGLFGLCRGCRVGLAACKQGCWLWQPLENPIIVRSFRATRRCIYYKMGGNYFWRGILIFMPLWFHKKNQGGINHTGLIGSRSFQNYAFKGWLSLETMKLWLLALTKTLFLMTLIIKLTLGNIFIKVKNPPGGATVTK